MTKVPAAKAGRPCFVDPTGVVYVANGDAETFLRPARDYEVRGLTNGHRLDPLAPFRCKDCGNDRLQIIRTDDYETSGRCPDCGFQAVVHDG